jgi:competence protein ComEA
MPAVRSTAGPPAATSSGGGVPSWNTATPTTVPARPASGSPPREGTADPRPVWGFTGSDRWFLTLSLTVMALLVTAHVWRDQQRRATPVEIVHPQGRYQYGVPLNSATWVEWSQLDGIGEKLARRIVADREANGPFATVDELGRVKGIGSKTLEKLRPFVTVVEPAAVAAGKDVK